MPDQNPAPGTPSGQLTMDLDRPSTQLEALKLLRSARRKRLDAEDELKLAKSRRDAAKSQEARVVDMLAVFTGEIELELARKQFMEEGFQAGLPLEHPDTVVNVDFVLHANVRIICSERFPESVGLPGEVVDLVSDGEARGYCVRFEHEGEIRTHWFAGADLALDNGEEPADGEGPADGEAAEPADDEHTIGSDTADEDADVPEDKGADDDREIGDKPPED